MRLYDYAASANCLKARILLRQLGVEWERVPVDLFAGESTTPGHLARNPAGRTPVLELDDGRTIPESNAILLYLADGTDLAPRDPVELARVQGWMFFEQNLVEPNVGTARFWRLTGRDEGRDQIVERLLEMGRGSLAALERQLSEHEFLVGDRYSAADISLYGYVHCAGDGGFDLSDHPGVEAWLRRVEATPGFENDLAPYPPNARAGVGDSLHA